MTYNQYWELAKGFVIAKPSTDLEQSYGLLEEFGETSGELKRFYRDDKPLQESYKKELGDFLWYTSQVVGKLGWDVFVDNEEPKYISKKDLIITFFRISGILSEIGINKALGKELGRMAVIQLFDNFKVIAKYNNLSLEDVAKTNIDKLMARKAKGTIQGSGSAR